MANDPKRTLREIATDLELVMRCNCDLDNWQPDTRSGHSWVCRIHKRALWVKENQNDGE